MLQAREDFEVKLVQGDVAKLPDALSDAHAVLVRTAELPEHLLANAKELEIVSRHGVGCDNVAVAALTARGIPVAIAVDANTTSVVEHVLMMMLALLSLIHI